MATVEEGDGGTSFKVNTHIRKHYGDSLRVSNMGVTVGGDWGTCPQQVYSTPPKKNIYCGLISRAYEERARKIALILLKKV